MEIDCLDIAIGASTTVCGVGSKILECYTRERWYRHDDAVGGNDRPIIGRRREGECGESKRFVAEISSTIELGVSGFRKSPDRDIFFLCGIAVHENSRPYASSDK